MIVSATVTKEESEKPWRIEIDVEWQETITQLDVHFQVRWNRLYRELEAAAGDGAGGLTWSAVREVLDAAFATDLLVIEPGREQAGRARRAAERFQLSRLLESRIVMPSGADEPEDALRVELKLAEREEVESIATRIQIEQSSRVRVRDSFASILNRNTE